MKNLILFFLFQISFSTLTFAKVSKQDALLLFNQVEKAYATEMASRNEKLIINPPMGPGMTNLDIAAIHASYTSYENIHYVNVFGGIIDLPNMTIDGLTIIICHEIGHGLGGAPLKKAGMSAEGQSDYYATKECLNKVFPFIPSTAVSPLPEEAHQICSEDASCLRGLSAIRDGFITLLNRNNDLNISIFSQDISIASETSTDDYYYPSPECRIQTLRNGLLQKERPSCWFKN